MQPHDDDRRRRPESRSCLWIFDLLGARAGDQFDDLLPGSGGVARAWQAYTRTPAASGAVGGAAHAGEVDGKGVS